MAERIPTPHNRGKKGDFADTVLMPGDPLRAKFIAGTYLENAELVTDVRNMLGYTGFWKGRRVSVMGGGMGMPSIGIYSHELFNFYDVKRIIRIGSTGSISERCHLMDLVIAEGACTNSNWMEMYRLGGTFAPTAPPPSRRSRGRRWSWATCSRRISSTMTIRTTTRRG